MRALVAACVVAVAGCASTRATRPAPPCPPVALPWTPRELPKTTASRLRPCLRATPTPGVDALRDGPDLDEALYCVERYYQGPDGLPIDAMLKAALDALVRQYPVAHRVAVSAIVDDVHDIESLTRTLLRVGALTRMTIGFLAMPPPEDVLLHGALSALAWQTTFRRPPFRDGKPAESYTAVAADGLVYVKVGALVDNLASRFRGELLLHPITGVILDLRGSPGGLYSEAIALPDLFLHDGCLVTTRPAVADASARDQFWDIDAPLVILVDQKTGSGAELIAATLRARDRAIIIGHKTTGNGLVQRVLMLSSGAALKLTIAEMLAADGTPFDGRGVEPDVELPASFEPDHSADDRAIDFAKRVLRGTHGGARSALLATARKLAARATR